MYMSLMMQNALFKNDQVCSLLFCMYVCCYKYMYMSVTQNALFKMDEICWSGIMYTRTSIFKFVTVSNIYMFFLVNISCMAGAVRVSVCPSVCLSVYVCICMYMYVCVCVCT